MDIYKQRGTTRDEIALLLSTCTFFVFVWSFFVLFHKFSSLILRYNIGELVGESAYILAFALFESVLFWLVLLIPFYIIALILPRRIFGAYFGVLSSVMAVAIVLFAIYYQLHPEAVDLLSLKRKLFYLGIFGLAYLAYYFFILRFPKFKRAVRMVFQKLSVLSIFYATLGILSVVIVIVRNLVNL